MFLRNILKVISENGLREHLSPKCCVRYAPSLEQYNITLFALVKMGS